MESERMANAVAVEQQSKSDNITDWSESILSHLYTNAISETKMDMFSLIVKCKKPKQPMLPVLPELGSYLKPTPEQAIPKCQPSHFGRDAELVYDESVRKSVELKLNGNQDVHLHIHASAQDAAVKLFGPNIKVTVDKLVIYSVGGKFDDHRDSIKSSDHIGTVVVQLPVNCEGGLLVVGKTKTPSRKDVVKYRFTSYDEEDYSDTYFDSEDDDDNRRSWYRECTKYPRMLVTAFYTDIMHNITEVTSGTRVSVTFRVERCKTPVKVTNWNMKLHVEEPTAVVGDGYDIDVERTSNPLPETQVDVACLQPFVDALKQTNKNLVVIGCRHMIPRAALNIQGLRGVDKIVADRLIKEGYSVTPTLVRAEEIEATDYSGSDVDGVRLHVCDLNEKETWTGVLIRPFNDYEAMIVEECRREHSHVGNEPGQVDVLNYIFAAMIVRRQ